MGKRMAALDSAHRIGPTTVSKEVLVADEGCSGWRFKNCDIWYIFYYCKRTDRDMDKWMVPLDSGH